MKPRISKCSMTPEWHQLVCMSGHVKESETATILQLYATSISQVHSFVLSTRLNYKKPIIWNKAVGLFKSFVMNKNTSNNLLIYSVILLIINHCRKRDIFRWGNFFPTWNAFFLVEIFILVDPVVSESEKSKKKKGPLLNFHNFPPSILNFPHSLLQLSFSSPFPLFSLPLLKAPRPTSGKE